jgi:hypothetical protein
MAREYVKVYERLVAKPLARREDRAVATIGARPSEIVQ